MTPDTTALALPREAKPAMEAMELLRVAVAQGAAIDTIERLAKLQREMVEYQAQLEFNEAMQRAQGKMRRIGTDATNPQTKSRYATYAKLDSTLRSIYADEGFSLSFDTAPDAPADTVRVLCYVSRGGHTRTYRVDMPADGKGAKGGDVMTKTHATGAAMSYGMRYLLKMIFNVAVGETDDDGNGAKPGLPEEVIVERLDWISEARDMDELQRVFREAYVGAQKFRDESAMKAYLRAKDARKEQLR